MYVYKDSKESRELEQNKNTIFVEDCDSKYWQRQALKFIDIMDKLKINCGSVRLMDYDTPMLAYSYREDSIYIDKKFLNALIMSYKLGYYKGITALMNHELGHKKDYQDGNYPSETSAERYSIKRFGENPEEDMSQQISISMFAYAGSDRAKAIAESKMLISLYGLREYFGEKAMNYIENRAISGYNFLIYYQNSINRIKSFPWVTEHFVNKS